MNWTRTQHIILVILLALVGYFIYHLVQGGRGILAKEELEMELVVAQKSLQDMEKKVAELSHKADLLRGPNICADLLEEEAKKQLAYSDPQEVVMPLNEKG
jgi:cell division protein FtsB